MDYVDFYADDDGDLYGDPAQPHPDNPSCEPPDGFASNPDDCDDGSAEVSPAADEVCGDGIDNDCDGEDRPCDVDDLPEDDLPVGCVVTCDGSDARGSAAPSALILLGLLLLPRRRRREPRSRARLPLALAVLGDLSATAPSPAAAADAPILALAVDPDKASRAVRRAAGNGPEVEVQRLDASMYLTRGRTAELLVGADGEALWGFHFAEAVAEFYATGSTTSAQPALRRALSMRPGEGYDPAYPPELEAVYVGMQGQVLGMGPATVVATNREDVWIDGVPVGLDPAPVVPGEHLLQVLGTDGKIRGGFVVLEPGQVLLAGDPKTIGHAAEALSPTLRATLARWLRTRVEADPNVRLWLVDGSHTIIALEGPGAPVLVGRRAPSVPLLVAIGGGWAAADTDSYGAASLDLSVGIVGPLRLHAWSRVTIGGGVASEVDGAVRVPILVPFGFGPELRFDGPVDPFVSVSFQLGVDQEGTEAHRLYPDLAPIPEAVPLGGVLVSGGVAIPLGSAPLEVRVVGEAGVLGRHPVARALVAIGVAFGGS